MYVGPHEYDTEGLPTKAELFKMQQADAYITKIQTARPDMHPLIDGLTDGYTRRISGKQITMVECWSRPKPSKRYFTICTAHQCQPTLALGKRMLWLKRSTFGKA